MQAGQLLVPFLVLATATLIVTFTSAKVSLPDLSATRAQGGRRLERSIWSFRHLTLGVVTIFFYVGTEVCIGSDINLHAMELSREDGALTFFEREKLVIGDMDMGIPALLATLYWGGFLIGRFVSSFFPNFNPRKVLIFTTVCATALITYSMVAENLWVLCAVGLFHSVMWSCIFTLCTRGLGVYTSKASGVFMMGVFGGAVFPVVQGFCADMAGSWRYTWLLCIVCELVMLAYALWGYKPRKEDLVGEA
jgi:FHS family L-fucose permease-like MFS transporter